MRKLVILFLWLCRLELNAQISNSLIWHEEFNDTTIILNASKWTYHYNLRFLEGNTSPYSFTDFVYKDGEFLHLRVDSLGKDGLKYRLPMVSTLNKYNFLYGRLDIKAKCPSERGAWPAIWMVQCGEIDSLNYGEIDIFEYIHCFEKKYYLANVHFVTQNNGKEARMTMPREIETSVDDWHVYSLIWLPGSLVCLLDDVEVHRVKKDEVEFWPYNKEYYLVMNVSFGEGWGSKCGYDEKNLPIEMLIDWIRYYPLDKTR